MGDCIDFGIISNIECDKDYSVIGGPENYKNLYEQYRCISIPDDLVNEWIPFTKDIPTYLCSLQKPFRGIAHYSVTLIPPESIEMFLEVIASHKTNSETEPIPKLVELIDMAFREKLYIICYGI